MKKSELKTIIKEESESWTQRDVENIFKAATLAMKSLDGAKRNIHKLSSEVAKHGNKPQGSTLGRMVDEKDINYIDRSIINLNKVRTGLQAMFPDLKTISTR